MLFFIIVDKRFSMQVQERLARVTYNLDYTSVVILHEEISGTIEPTTKA